MRLALTEQVSRQLASLQMTELAQSAEHGTAKRPRTTHPRPEQARYRGAPAARSPSPKFPPDTRAGARDRIRRCSRPRSAGRTTPCPLRGDRAVTIARLRAFPAI